jgi:DUF971 family protein
MSLRSRWNRTPARAPRGANQESNIEVWVTRATDPRHFEEFPRVQLLEDGALLLEWPDGHQTVLSAEFLRRECPCAACRGRPAGSPPPPGRLIRSEPVGRYALQLAWSDGHSTGIYPYRFLRESCACLHCRTSTSGSRFVPEEESS